MASGQNYTSANGNPEKVALNDGTVVDVSDGREDSSIDDSHQPKTFSERVKLALDPKKSIEDLTSLKFWSDMVVESIIVGYVLCVVMFLLVTCNTSHYEPGTTHFGLFAGFMIFAVVEAWTPICGCLLNPAAVIGFYIAGRMSFARAVFSFLFEIAGAAAGTMIGYSLNPQTQRDSMHALKQAPGLTVGQGLVIEGVVTFNLVAVALFVTIPGKHTKLATLAIGFVKGTGLLAAGTHTGGIQNPAIAMGPALATKNFTNHFAIYWAGPFIGAIIAAILYRIVITVNDRHERITKKQQRTGVSNSKLGKLLPIFRGGRNNNGV